MRTCKASNFCLPGSFNFIFPKSSLNRGKWDEHIESWLYFWFDKSCLTIIIKCHGSQDIHQKLDYFTRTCKASRIKLFCKLFWGLMKQQYPRWICAKDYPLYSVSATPHSWCLPAGWMLGWWRPLPGQHRHLQGTIVLSSGMSLTCSLWSIACTQQVKVRNLVFYAQSTSVHRKCNVHSHVTCWYSWQPSNARAYCCPGC